MIFKCYDTCSLLKSADNLFNNSDEFKLLITSITLEELEQIKTSSNKDSETKAAARHVLSKLEEHAEDFRIILYHDAFGELMIKDCYNLTNDAKIIACARHFSNSHPDCKIIFVTNDLLCKQIASCYFEVEKVIEEEYEYDGFKEVFLDEEETANFYSNLDKNIYDLFINEYLLIYDKNSGECIDKLRWTEEGYKNLNYETFSSRHFGDIKPIKNDVYQALLADSLSNNKITMVQGFAGSGKTTLSLGYLMYLLDRHRIDKIIIFCNTVATKNSAKLGFYPGTRDEKLLDSQIGNLLASKFGDRIIVEQMIQEGKLVLLPMSDIRGYDTSGMRAGIYISEAQNLDISLMKLALQRIGEDNVCIIDGDRKAQVDDASFAGNNNGMKRVSQVFRGEDIYGEVTLKKIHRSRIAQIAERL